MDESTGNSMKQAPEQKFGDVDVSVGAAKVVEDHLRHLGGVFEEAEQSHQHLHLLNGRQVIRRLLYVLQTQTYALVD